MPNIYIYIYCIIWLLLLGLQNLGFWEFLRRKTDTQAVFLPGATAVIQISLLFFAGILNLLPQVTALLWVFGIGAFFYCWWKDKSLAFLRNYISFPYLYLFLFSIIFLVFLHGKKLVQYDNFSHWGLIVKALLLKNRFPNFLDENYVMFQEYPLGSAVYLYYCMHFSGTPSSEWKMMFCQAYLYLAFLMPIFRSEKKNSGLVFLLAVLFTNFALVFFGPIADLLVDRLLALAGMCMLCYVAEHCGAGKLSVSTYLITAAFLVTNLQIKNSSVFFVIIVCVLILWAGREDRQWAERISLIGIAILAYLLWNQHCKLVYSAPELSKHAMNFSNYAVEASEKSLGEMLAITKELVYFIVKSKDTWSVAISALLVGVFVACLNKKQLPTYCKQLLFVLVCFLAYILGMLGMYVFSMPSGEAIVLAGVGRYYGSAILAVLYWECYCCSSILSRIDWGRKEYIALSVAILLFFPVMQYTCNYPGTFLTRTTPEYDYANRAPVDEALATVGEDYAQYDYTVICANRMDYYGYMMRYLCPESSIRFISSEKPIDEQGIDTYYCIVLDWDSDYVRQWVQEGKYVRVGDWLMERAE